MRCCGEKPFGRILSSRENPTTETSVHSGIVTLTLTTVGSWSHEYEEHCQATIAVEGGHTPY